VKDATTMGMSRRQFLPRALAMVVAAGAAARANAASCASPQGADASLRASLHYVESSPNPAQRCSGCSFFSDPQGDCGSCMIFSAPANINGHCDSWSPRS
jgi:nitrous oxide reductase